MSKIRFVNVPRSYRRSLIGNRVLSGSKLMDVAIADQRVKKLAKKLTDDRTVKLDLEIEPDQDGQAFSVYDVHIEHADQNLGLRSIADRLVIDSSNEEKSDQNAERLANLLESELRDDQEDTATDMDYLFSDSESKGENEDESIQNDQRPVRGVAPTEIEESNDKNTEEVDSEAAKEGTSTPAAKPQVAPDPKDFYKGTEDEYKSEIAEPAATEKEVIARSAYIADKNIFQAVPDKNYEQIFDLTEIKRRLGYVDNPQDKYQRKLNAQIDSDLEKCHLKNAAAEYEREAAKLKNATINKLNESYSEVNKVLIEDTVQGQANNEILEKNGQASEEKQTNQKEAEQKIAAKKQELADEMERRIAEFKRQIEEEMRHRQEAVENEQRLWLEKRNNQVDQDLKQKEKAVKDKFRLQEVQKRNNELRDLHQQTENSYSQELEKLFNQHKNKFATNLVHLERSVQTQSSRIDRQKKKDEKTKEMLTQQQAKIQAINRANQLKEKELKYLEQHDKEFPTKLTETLSAGVANAIKEALKEQQKAAAAGKTIDLDKAIGEHIKANSLLPVVTNPDKELVTTGDFEKIDNQASQVRGHKTARVLGLAAVLLLGVGAAGYGYWYYQPKTMPITQTQKSAKDHAKQSKDSQAKSKQVAGGPVQGNQSKNKRKVHDSNVILYRAAKRWSAKIDVLDGALGQGDIRALKEINDAHPTWISRLYYAVAANDQAGMRAIYLQLTPRQKEKTSYAARHAIALSFYNIKDWQNGWLARNGY